MHYLFDGPEEATVTLVFAHGAGGAMDTPFMARVAKGLGEKGVRVARFEFPYMAARRAGGKRGAPDRPPVLMASFREAVDGVRHGRVFIGGKSMGGRMATMIADEAGVDGVIVFGYPFHPPGQPDRLRTGHLAAMRTPALILQGERDMFGTREEVASYRLSNAIAVEWVTDGDHSFKARKGSGTTEKQNVLFAIERAAAFMKVA